MLYTADIVKNDFAAANRYGIILGQYSGYSTNVYIAKNQLELNPASNPSDPTADTNSPNYLPVSTADDWEIDNGNQVLHTNSAHTIMSKTDGPETYFIYNTFLDTNGNPDTFMMDVSGTIMTNPATVPFHIHP